MKSHFQIILCLLLLVSLSLSCTSKKSSEASAVILESTKNKTLDISEPDTSTQLEYTSGIRSILQDSQGNYWLGSHQEGACFFDGKKFTYFTMANGLSDNQVRTIQKDSDGTIWFGTANGVSSFKEGLIKNHTLSFLGSSPIDEGNWALANEDLWFNAGNAPGVYRYDGERVYYLAFPIQEGTNSSPVYGNTGFSKGKKGNIWIATYSAVFGYDGKTFEVIDDEFLGFTKESGRLHIRSILEDSKGNLWIGNNGIGVLLKRGDSIINFSQENGLIQAIGPTMGNPSPPGTLEHVFAITEDSQGNIWFGDRDTGAWKYDGQSMTNYTVDEQLSSPMIWDIYEDKDKNLLFAMAEGGVYLFDGKSFKIKF